MAMSMSWEVISYPAWAVTQRNQHEHKKFWRIPNYKYEARGSFCQLDPVEHFYHFLFSRAQHIIWVKMAKVTFNIHTRGRRQGAVPPKKQYELGVFHSDLGYFCGTLSYFFRWAPAKLAKAPPIFRWRRVCPQQCLFYDFVTLTDVGPFHCTNN